MTRVWDAEFPTMAMKLVALKLADCANDDGENIYPWVRSVEAATGVSESAVREALADMEASGLLAVTGSMKDDKRPGRSRPIRAFDVERLDALHHKRATLTWVRVETPVHDVRTGEPKRTAYGAVRMRPAWRLADPSGVQPLDPQGSSHWTSGGPATGEDGSSHWTPPGPATGPPSKENPSLTNPSTHPSSRVCASETPPVAVERTPLDELADEGEAGHVVEHLLRPLWGVLKGKPSAELLRAMRDDLAGFGDAALAEAATTIRQTRSTWPSVAQAREAVQAAQRAQMVRIEPGTTAWAAWSAHWHRQGHKFLARTYESQGFAMVQRQFPPVEGGR